MKYTLNLLLPLLVLGGLASCDQSKEVKQLRLAHSLNEQHPVHRGMAHMAERLKELSDSTVVVRIYPNGQLGVERVTAELTQLGALDMTKVASSVITNFIPEMKVFSLPYLFESSDHYWRVFKSDIGKQILLSGEKFNLRGLCFYDAGFRSFILRNKKVTSPQDLQGLKIRVMESNMQIRTINELGGNANPLAFGELYSAMQQGVVDGADGNPPVMLQTNLYDVSEYYVLDEHSAPPDVMLMSTFTWNRLTDQEKKWLQQAVEESVDYQRKLWKEAREEALKTMSERGLNIIRDLDKEPFRERVKPIYESLDPEISKIVDQIRAMAPSETDSVQKTVQKQ